MADEAPMHRARVTAPPIFRGSDAEDANLWLWQLEQIIPLGACTEAQRTTFAIVHMAGVALRWARGQVFATWDAFVAGFRHRFCQEDEDTILQRLQHLRQGDGQSARQLADMVRTLCSQLEQVTPNQMKTFFIRALRPVTRQLVTARQTATLAAAESVATDLERMERQTSGVQDIMAPDQHERQAIILPEPAQASAATSQKTEQRSPVDALMHGFETLRLEFAQMKESTNKRDTYRPRMPIRCHSCGEEGHVVRDCPRNHQQQVAGNNRQPAANQTNRQAPQQPANRAMNLAQYHDEPEQGIQPHQLHAGVDNRSEIQRFLDEEYGEAQFATRGVRDDAGDERRQPRKRPHVTDAWDIDAAEPRVPDLAPRDARRQPRVRIPGVQTYGGLYHVVDQLKATKANASMWTYLQDSARARGELLTALQGQSEAAPSGSGPAPGPAPVPPVGPEPMMHFTGAKTEGKSSLLYSVVTCEVAIGPVTFEAVVDSGASNTTISHIIARKLGMLDFMEDTSLVFTTSSGETDRPWGILRGVPLTVGKLTLPLDMCVTGARGYEMLLGNDWSFSAQATLHIGNKEMSFRLSRDHADTVPLRCGPIRRTSLSKSSKGKAVSIGSCA